MFLKHTLLISTIVCSIAVQTSAYDTQKKRYEMIEHQIVSRGITDKRVIEAMKKVPRHLFIPENNRSRAYDDCPVPIGYGQTISQPYIVAYMTELLALQKDFTVLEIGTGSGYQAAILSEIVGTVYSIEILPQLAERAQQTLQELHYDSVHVKTGDGYQGWPEHAPFDAIVVTAAPDHVPQPLIDQLKEGGTLVIPVGMYPYQELKQIKKTKNGIQERIVTAVLFVPMTGEAQKK